MSTDRFSQPAAAPLPEAGTTHFSALPFAALLAGAVAIGFAGILMRLADVNPLASAFWRMGLAAPLLWLWALSTAQQDRAAGRHTGFTPALLLAGGYFAGDMALWHLSLHFTTVSNATLLSNFAPVFIALWMWLAWGRRFKRGFVVGMLIALAGAVLLVAPNAQGLGSVGGGSGAGGAGGAGGANSHKLLGDGLGLGSAVFYAGYQLVIKNARNRYSTARLMAWSTTITGLALLPLALAAPGPFLPLHAARWLPLLGLALLAQIGGQTVIAYASAHLPASLSSVSLLLQPLTAAIAAWLIFGEAIAPLQMLGGVLLLWGISLSKRSGG